MTLTVTVFITQVSHPKSLASYFGLQVFSTSSCILHHLVYYSFLLWTSVPLSNRLWALTFRLCYSCFTFYSLLPKIGILACDTCHTRSTCLQCNWIIPTFGIQNLATKSYTHHTHYQPLSSASTLIDSKRSQTRSLVFIDVSVHRTSCSVSTVTNHLSTPHFHSVCCNVWHARSRFITELADNITFQSDLFEVRTNKHTILTLIPHNDFDSSCINYMSFTL